METPIGKCRCPNCSTLSDLQDSWTVYRDESGVLKVEDVSPACRRFLARKFFCSKCSNWVVTETPEDET